MKYNVSVIKQIFKFTFSGCSLKRGLLMLTLPIFFMTISACSYDLYNREKPSATGQTAKHRQTSKYLQTPDNSSVATQVTANIQATTTPVPISTATATPNSLSTSATSPDPSSKPAATNLISEAMQATRIPTTMPLPAVGTPVKTPLPADATPVNMPEQSDRQVIIVMFHRFEDNFKVSKYDKGEYVNTIPSFKALLERLYNMGFRMVSLTDFLEGKFSIEKGRIPIVFTFDDGSPGQFHLNLENKRLTVAKNTAVYVMEEFYKRYPDFGLEGTFFVNLGDGAFKGEGNLSQRLSYLVSKGYEIGNHTKDHYNLKNITSKEKIQEQLGGNEIILRDLLSGHEPELESGPEPEQNTGYEPGYETEHETDNKTGYKTGYRMISLALPLGNKPPQNFSKYLAQGVYKNHSYKIDAVLKVGWKPAPVPWSNSFDKMSLPRVRATGIKKETCDLDWWLDRLDMAKLYIKK